MDNLTDTLIIGVGATVVMDLWGLLRRALFGIASPDYGLVGRWLGGWAHGRFRHQAIAKSSAIRGERWLGWTAHYLTGIAFAALLVSAAGRRWLHQPTLVPALLVGIATVAAPLLVMQPGMGAGIAASRTPHPTAARLQSLITHTVFGLGLYITGWLVSRYAPLL